MMRKKGNADKEGIPVNDEEKKGNADKGRNYCK